MTVEQQELGRRLIELLDGNGFVKQSLCVLPLLGVDELGGGRKDLLQFALLAGAFFLDRSYSSLVLNLNRQLTGNLRVVDSPVCDRCPSSAS